MFYLSLTLFHFVHVIMGMVILGAIAIKAARDYSASDHAGVETGASYWHMVDLVRRIVVLCNSCRNAEAGPRDKQD